MDHGEREIHSFVIKLWCEEGASPTGDALWRGHITHVASGKRRYVQDPADIPMFIDRYLAGGTRSSESPNSQDID